MDENQDIKKNPLQEELAELEAHMAEPTFWSDKDRAQAVIRRIADVKAEIAGEGKYDSGDAVMTIFSGAGGDDAEDFSAILLNMYLKFLADKKTGKSFSTTIVHANENDHGGYRNITIEISGKGAYGMLKNESGVHRLVRISPFNAKSLRHTSFSMVEVIPKFEKSKTLHDLQIPEDELKVEFSRSSGPGGQNVNKRETAVRVVHIPTNLSAQSDNERSQAQNKEKAMQILQGKLYKALEEERVSKEKGMYISKTTKVEWGNQIRSYVMHPYKMVKDHRTNVETSNIDGVLNGDLEEFIAAEKDLK